MQRKIKKLTEKGGESMGLTMITCGADWKHILNGARETYNALRKVIK